MFVRSIGSAFVAALVVGLGAGCNKTKSGPEAPPVETVARIHWLGMERLAAETNAAFFMDIWKLPASERLGGQTLDKLSLAPWRLLKGDAATNGAPISLLRPLLDDLVREESYLEIRNATNQPGELVLAIRLTEARARTWETNLATVFESLTGVHPVAATAGNAGWSLKKQEAPKLIELTRTGEWTLVSMSPEPSPLLADVMARIQQNHAPFVVGATNFWLEASLDLSRISSALSLGWNLPEELPKVTLTVTTDGQAVITDGTLKFARPQTFDLEAWNIPTNLIHDPVISFTAIRGVKPWLASHRVWTRLGLGTPPNQVCLWAVQGIPVQTYFAAPMEDASNQVYKAAELLTQKASQWMPTNSVGTFVRATNFNGAVWAGVPFMSPFLKSVGDSGGSFAFGGLFPTMRTNLPCPGDLMQELLRHTNNLVCYDWELTGQQIEGLIYTGQLLRLIFHKAQIPPGSAAMAWLKAAAPKLGNCATVFTKTGDGELSFYRRSHVGFTAVELHLLADWLESPEFPRGFHTQLATAPLK